MTRIPRASFGRLYGRSLAACGIVALATGGAILMLPLRRWFEPVVAVLLDVFLSGRRGSDNYHYAPGHYPWAVGALILLALIPLGAAVYQMLGARQDDRRLTCDLENRLDEQAARNTRDVDAV